MKLLLLFAIYLVILPALLAEAGFASRFSKGSRLKYPGRKPYLRDRPWESGSYSRYKVRQPWESYDEKDKHHLDDQEESMKKKYRNKSYGARGCVGLCLYNKMHGKKKVTSAPALMKTDLKSSKLKGLPEKATSKPCVGLCQYYKQLGIPDPWATRKRISA